MSQLGRWRLAALAPLGLAGCSLLADFSSLSAGGDDSHGIGGTGAQGGAGGAPFGGAGGAAGGSGGSGGEGAASVDAYTDAVLEDTPVAWWRLDDRVTPDALDSGPNGQHGTYVGGVELNQPGITEHGASVLFGGSSARMEVTTGIDFPLKAPFSMEAWITPQDEAGFIAGKMTYEDQYRGWMLVLTPGGLRFQRHGSTNLQGGLPLQGEWNHAVGTFDGVTSRLYVNGEEVDVKAQNGDVEAVDTAFKIGSDPTWGALEGWIDEVALYDYALPPARVLAHYRAGIAR